MRRAITTALAVATVGLALGLVACGGDDDAGAGAPAATSAAAAPTVTSFDGAVCSAREPDPPADPQTYDAPPPQTIDVTKVYRATLDTACGDIVIRLDPKRAPRTVNNFVFLAREGFYDGLTFHRVVRGFVIQGGDPAGDGSGGPGYTFADELPKDGYPPGSVAMANAGPGTNGSQFFVTVGETPWLNGKHTIFGQVTEGYDVVEAIAKTPVAQDKPVEDVVIERIEITE